MWQEKGINYGINIEKVEKKIAYYMRRREFNSLVKNAKKDFFIDKLSKWERSSNVLENYEWVIGW